MARVQEWKYLGIILSENLSNSKDIDRAMYAFLRQFNLMYSKFYYLDRHALFFFFKLTPLLFMAMKRGLML